MQTIHLGTGNPVGNVAIIAPGTGLGEAGLYWDGGYLHPFATEGGHSDFSPRSKIDTELFHYLRSKYGHVSWERVVSGPGLYEIFLFLNDIKGFTTTKTLQKQIESERDPQKVISAAAIEGSEVCRETIQLLRSI